MIKEKYFLKKRNIRNYRVQGLSFNLEVNRNVFPPPLTPSILSRNIKVFSGETVIDIGTGTGFLAILASKLGGRVCGVDISKNAIDLSIKNAKLNKEKIKFEISNLFDKYKKEKKKFDVIIANLSQTFLSKKAKNELGISLAKSVDGGQDGNEVVLQFLNQTRGFMHNKSRLYLNVYSVSDYRKTIEEILKKYSIKILELGVEPVKSFVANDINYYLKLNKLGKINIFYDNKRKEWLAYQFALELKLKKD